MEAQKVRLAAYDGRLSDLGSGAPAAFVPLISSNWNSTFTWQGVGEMPADQRATLRRVVDTAHTNGQRVRFWATPDVPGTAREAVWSELVGAGVDHLNTDDLPGLQEFLLLQGADAQAALECASYTRSPISREMSRCTSRSSSSSTESMAGA